MENVKVSSLITHTIIVPAKKQFSNEKDLTFKFGKGEKPVEMPEDIFESYNESKPGVYSTGKSKVSTGGPESKVDGGTDTNKFDAAKWLESQAKAEEGITRETLGELELDELFILAKVCKVKNLPRNTGKPKLIERILGVIAPEE